MALPLYFGESSLASHGHTSAMHGGYLVDSIKNILVDYGKGRSESDGLPRYSVWKKAPDGRLLGLLGSGDDWELLQREHDVSVDNLHINW